MKLIKFLKGEAGNPIINTLSKARSWWPGLEETCPALRNRWCRLMPHLGRDNNIQLASLVLKSLLFCSPSSRKGSSSLPAAFLTIPLFLSLQKFSEELRSLGEWCEMFQSCQLHFTGWHGLLYLKCSSEPCFKIVADWTGD